MTDGRLDNLSRILQPLLQASPSEAALFISILLFGGLLALLGFASQFSRVVYHVTGIDMQGLGLLALERSRRWRSNSQETSEAVQDHEIDNALRELDSGSLDRKSHTFPGLLNTSTTCYLNSTCQSLASLPSFVAYLRTLLDSASSAGTDLELTSALYKLLKSLNTPSKRSVILRTDTIVQSLMSSTSNTPASRNRRRVMQGSGQQDAQEFFLILAEAVEEEKKVIFDKLAQRKAEKVGFQELLMPVDLLKAATRIAYDDSLKNPFQATMAHRTSCMTCGYTEAIRHLPTEHLTLNVPATRSCRLETMLAEHTKLELIEEYSCRRCSILSTHDRLSSQSKGEKSSEGVTSSKKKRMRETSRTVSKLEAIIDSGNFETDLVGGPAPIKLDRIIAPATKQAMYAIPPKCLVIHLSRSSFFEGGYGSSMKNNCQAVFPEYLNMDPYTTSERLSLAPNQPISQCKQELQDGNSAGKAHNVYRICAVVVHFGSHSYGHYVSFRRRLSAFTRPALADAGASGDEWYRISDETVELSTTDEMLRANPFLLFYERVADASGASIGYEAVEDQEEVAGISESWEIL